MYGDTNSKVPLNILQNYKEKRQRRKIKLFIVHFFDKQSSWQSVPRDKLQLLGEDKSKDCRIFRLFEVTDLICFFVTRT